MRSTPLAALLLLLVGSACVSSISPPGSHFSSAPPGARVLIDGQDAGYLTPCEIGLDPDREYDVRLELIGYEPAEFRLVDSTEIINVPYSQAVAYTARWRLFLFYPGWIMFAPFKIRSATSPWRVYAQLDPSTAARGDS